MVRTRSFRLTFVPRAGIAPVIVSVEAGRPVDETEMDIAQKVLEYIRATPIKMGRGLAATIHLDLRVGEVTRDHGDVVVARLVVEEVGSGQAG